MSKRILILGAGEMQGVSIRIARERGWKTVVIDGNPAAPCRNLADRFEPIDLKDVPAIVDFARDLQNNGGLDGVFTAATDFSVPVAAAAAACGLPGHGLEAAKNASDKLRMRACFAAAGVPSPRCAGVTRENLPGIAAVLKDTGIRLPVVVKPADSMGARGCVRVNEENALEIACADALRYSRSGTAIVEEYMEGPEFSVEALVFDGEFHLTGFADRHICFPPYFVEMGHTIPTALPEADRERIISVFRAGTEALGLSHGAAKGDIKLTPDGPMVGEIAARLSGGYMSGWTFPYSSGIDLTGAALSLAVGERPGELEPSVSKVCAERAWISLPGTVASVYGLEEAAAIPGVRNVIPRAGAGDRVVFPRNNVEKCGNCLAVHEHRDEAIRLAEKACAGVFLRLAASDPATGEFLSGKSDEYPPSAFDLERLPETVSYLPVKFSFFDAVPVPETVVHALDSARDWQGRLLRDAVEQAVAFEPGLADKLVYEDKKVRLQYWNALLRGGIQGIVYTYDCDKQYT